MKVITKSILSICMVVLTMSAPVLAAQLPYPTYTYTYKGEVVESPAAYKIDKILSFDEVAGEKKPLLTPSDIFVDSQNNCYISDTGNDRILVLDNTYKLKKIIDKISDTLEVPVLKAPEGIFVTNDGDIYICDTGNARLVILNEDYSFKQVIEKLESAVLPKGFIFNPKAVAVDKAKRIYTTVKGNIMGTVAITRKGEFDTFMGAQKVVPNFIDLFWRKFMTQEQIDRLPSFVPTEFNNIEIDKEGFLYVTTNSIAAWNVYSGIVNRSKAGDYAPVKKLSPSGVDVLNRNGFFPPSGEVKMIFDPLKLDAGPSSIVDLAIGENEVYSLLDSKRGRIFTYNSDGHLLYVFGRNGQEEGCFLQASAISYKGKNILVLDKRTGKLTIFDRTPYGDTINEAIKLYNNRQYDKSAEKWASLTNVNNNFDIAYIGLGKSYLRSGDYNLAMKYFMLSSDKINYSKALAEKRKEDLGKYLILIFFGTILIIVLLGWLFGKIKKHNDMILDDRKSRWYNQVLYGLYVNSHPFKGVGEIKGSNRGSVISALVILTFTIVVFIAKRILSGYLFTGSNNITEYNILDTILSIGLPIILFCVANWCLTSLMNGEGRFKDIFIVACYSTLPIALINVPLIFLSNVMTLEDTVIFTMISTFSYIWCGFILFTGIAVIHDYSFTKNLVTIILTIAGMIVIAFFGVLFANLIYKVFNFVYNLYMEISLRM